MIRRRCTGCGTPLGGRLGHGFVKGRPPGRLVCGRGAIEKVIGTAKGQRTIYVPSPGCRA